ncbi:trihelix transcription factor GT-3b-like [Durio zibethinus]|uniref:Trihelix transcription factor GT-3b-like n=1 Tax=Durio zibethinus TaxID=66656 RepID=A0A6P6ASC5_DURZI|nr:trihelix transcription factor GT-3b-like [Durio zibethinus]
MEGHQYHHHHRHHHQQQQQHQQQPISVNVDVDRFPQWSIQETREFLIIRADLDRSFMETKRNKLLWEVISTRMREKGYNRSAEQCKCKWKNLVTRYKGCETMEAEAMRQQFPFYNELQAIFSARMQNILGSEGEGGATGSKKKAVQLSSDEEEDMEENETDRGSFRKKKKGKTGAGIGGSSNNNIKEILDDFMRQQMQMEMQWREAFEARENERRLKEMEWRQTMEALENERIMMDRRWREREEERRMREEARAEKRDALITALLNKIIREDHI